MGGNTDRRPVARGAGILMNGVGKEPESPNGQR